MRKRPDVIWSDERIATATKGDGNEQLLKTVKRIRDDYEQRITEYETTMDFMEKNQRALLESIRLYDGRRIMYELMIVQYNNMRTQLEELQEQTAA